MRLSASSLIVLTLCAVFSCPLVADGISYDRLTLPVSGEWKRIDKPGYAAFERQGKGAIVFLASAKPGVAASVYLDRLIKTHTEGRTLVTMNPQQIVNGKTQSGVSFAAQARVTRGAQDVWYVMYYAFQVGDSVQAVMVLAENAALFKDLAKETSPVFEQIQVVSAGSQPAPARPENQGTPATSFFQQTGPASDQFVSGVVAAQSAELKPVQFRVTGGMRFGTLSASDSDMVMSARDKDGNLYIIESSVGVFGSTDRAQFIHRIKNFGAPEKLDWSRRAAMINVNRLSKEKVDLFFADVSPIHTLRTDEKGNLYVGISIDHDNAFFSLERGGESKLLASMSQLSRAANGYQTGGTASRLYVSQSGTAWLMVQGVEKQGGKDYGTNAYFLERADGGWKATQVPVRCQGQPCAQKTKYTIFANGTVDADGGWIFYDGAGFWRATKDGDVRQLARLKLPAGDVTITGPVVLANGDIWYAFSTDYSVVTGGTVNQQTGYYDARNTWFTVGDRSRLVRIRVKDGAVQLGEISSERVLAALREQKLPLRPDSQVMKTVRLVPDYATGGLLVFDGHHSVLYGIQPRD